MSETKQKFDIFIAHPDEATRDTLKGLVKKLGHKVAGLSGNCRTTRLECSLKPPTMIISGVEFPDGNGIDTLITIAEDEPLPSIIVTHKDDIDMVEHAMDDHVMAYLIDPVSFEDLKPTVYVVKRRFEQMQELKEEVEDLQEALATRKKLERAKALMMQHDEITEEEAYLKIRKLATSSNRKMGEVVGIVLESFAK